MSDDPTGLVARDRAHVWHPYASVVEPSPLYPVVAADRKSVV